MSDAHDTQTDMAAHAHNPTRLVCLSTIQTTPRIPAAVIARLALTPKVTEIRSIHKPTVLLCAACGIDHQSDPAEAAASHEIIWLRVDQLSKRDGAEPRIQVLKFVLSALGAMTPPARQSAILAMKNAQA